MEVAEPFSEGRTAKREAVAVVLCCFNGSSQGWL